MSAEQALLEIEGIMKDGSGFDPAAISRIHQAVTTIRQAHGSSAEVSERLDSIRDWAEILASTKPRPQLELGKLRMNIFSECINLRSLLARRSSAAGQHPIKP